MKDKIIKLGKLEIDLDELSNFLVKAKKKAYAGDGNYITLTDGSKQFVFRNENSPFYFTDNYKGHYQFVGSENVEIEVKGTEHPETDFTEIWRMNYFGRIEERFREDDKLVKDTYKFLKQALSNTTTGFPFRGVGNFTSKDGRWEYIVSESQSNDDLNFFKGYEKIYNKGREIYSGDYHGGLIIPK